MVKDIARKGSPVSKSGFLLKKYIEEAKEFWGISSNTVLRQDALLSPAARWNANGTTLDSFTIEYSSDLRHFPDWAIKVVAFHEVCHFKQALEGLPIFAVEPEHPSLKRMSKGDSVETLKNKFNVCEFDLGQLASDIGIQRGDAEMLFWDSYVVATDFLVNSELIKASPVSFDNMKTGIATVDGCCISLGDPQTRLDSVLQSGLWTAISENFGFWAHPVLVRNILSKTRCFENKASSSYGLNLLSYRSYVSAIESVNLTKVSSNFASSLRAITTTIVPLLNETNSVLRAGFLKRQTK